MPQFSSRSANLHASPIREILAVIERPGMISFAGGLPSEETFPKFDITQVPSKYLQYGPSEGEPELRNEISTRLQKIGLNCDKEQLLVLSGSQQGIDLIAKLFIDPGTVVTVESPTYLAALQVFNFFGAQLTSINIDKPERSLKASPKPVLAYVIPTFQNPTGHCYSRDQREQLAIACDNNGTTLFEDDPYRELKYDDCDRTPVCSLLQHSSWVYQGSFSKTLAPGLRLGFLACSKDLIQPLTQLKQAADLHSNRLSQWLVLEQIQSHFAIADLQKLARTYKKKRDFFAQLLNTHFAEHAQWQIPQGGLFFWLKLNRAIDTDLLLKQAIKHNVAFMPGQTFFADIFPKESFIRLNFSHASEQEMEQGLKVLAKLIAIQFSLLA